MKNCTNCEHAIFDPWWGDYKCDISKHTHIVSSSKNDCKDWNELKGEMRIAARKEPNQQTLYD